jgi:ATP synthase protein I
MPGLGEPPKGKKGRELRQIGLLGTIPFMLATGPFVGYFIGDWLDNKFGTDPVLLIIFLVLGFAASVKETAKIIKEASREPEE